MVIIKLTLPKKTLKLHNKIKKKNTQWHSRLVDYRNFAASFLQKVVNLVFLQLFLDDLHLRVDGFLRFQCLLLLLQFSHQRSVATVKLCCLVLGLLQLNLQ